MSVQPKIAAIVVSWNNGDILAECFDSLRQQTMKDQVVFLVDNGSTDDSVAMTRKLFPWVNIIEAGSNLGFTKANNLAISEAMKKYPSLEYIALLNSDARIVKHWYKTMYHFAKKKPHGAFFQGITFDYYNHDIIDSTHIYIARNGSGTQANWRKIYTGEIGPKRVFGVNFAAALVSCDFIRAQPFATLQDETMFMYLDDLDACVRATVMGWENYLVPGAAAYHMGSASSNKRPGFSLYMTYRNNIALLVKNLPLSMVVRMMPEIVRADYHTARHLILRNQKAGVWIIIKGRVVGFLRLPLYTKQIIRMRKYRRNASKSYLWQLMKTGYLN